MFPSPGTSPFVMLNQRRQSRDAGESPAFGKQKEVKTAARQPWSKHGLELGRSGPLAREDWRLSRITIIAGTSITLGSNRATNCSHPGGRSPWRASRRLAPAREDGLLPQEEETWLARSC